ncbi:unnamed protein product [Lactuca virosa]|uniref:Transposase (putative) gypsy type domain-containing protein n=1 Tax=Lactuca virosa TaxID=75947 RepID=A0AAU9MRN2_9ASTR|nr:unnamed protein product [Lactuca virosa]
MNPCSASINIASSSAIPFTSLSLINPSPFFANKDISSIHIVMSKLTPQSLADITKKYDVDPQFQPCLSEPGTAIINAHEGFVSVYQVLFKSGLRFPTFDFLRVVLDYYDLHITQITPNGFRNIICFVMICPALDIVPTLMDEFLFVRLSAFLGTMAYGISYDRAPDPTPELTLEE